MNLATPLRGAFNLSDLLDYFIPHEMQVNAESHRRARMFMLSHLFGPFLGSAIPLYMVAMDISRDYRAAVFVGSILLFWAYPFALRARVNYQLLALLSVQNLIFCALWACYAYGGTGSPFLPWILIFPLLAFLYLPPQGWIRNTLLVQIFGSVAAFLALVFSGHRLPAVDLDELQTIGMISMASVAIYFAMMSLYFAKMYAEQREFAREINSLVSTSDNLRELTTAANQASAAKADFVAGMSHELRTPLNAIIGYSQLLLEEAEDERDEETVTDLSHIHRAGSELLHLIDDILCYSRIEAGKMPLNPGVDNAARHLARWLTEIEPSLDKLKTAVTVVGDIEPHPLFSDWTVLGSAVKHLVVGIAGQHPGGSIAMALESRADGALAFVIRAADRDGAATAPTITQEMFEASGDTSATKYGGTGIEMALSHKLAVLIGADIQADVRDADPVTIMIVADYAAEPTALAA